MHDRTLFNNINIGVVAPCRLTVIRIWTVVQSWAGATGNGAFV